MGSIAFAPSSPTTVYAGTGEQAGIGFDIYYGAGVLKSSDSGSTWTQTCTTPSATCPFIFPFSDITPFGFFTLGGMRLSYIAVNPNNPAMVLVAAQEAIEGPAEGIYCTQDSGATWTNILPGEMATFVGFAPSSTTTSTAYAALGNTFGSSARATNGNGIYKALGINASSACPTIRFTRISAATLPSQANMGRIDIGIAPSDPTGNTLYASIADATTESATNIGVFATTNGGTTWTLTGAPDICQVQCWYDNVVRVDPNNKDIVYFGGSAVADANTGIFKWIMRSINGTTGGSFSPVIPTVNSSTPALPHVDQHAMAFVNTSSGVRMYLGNDGGIWRTDNAEASSVTWVNLNNAPLQLTQFYPSIAMNPANPTVAFGGTQDNGSQNFQGGVAWLDNQLCGDGASAAVDQQIPSTVYIGCATGAQVNSSVTNGAIGSFTPATGGINPADYSGFVPPLTVDPSSPNVAYFGTTAVYQTTNAGASWTFLGGLSGAPHSVTAITVAPTNPNVVYAGVDTGQAYVAFNAFTITPGVNGFAQITGVSMQTMLPQRFITAIAVDPADTTGNTAYIAMSGFSFVSGNVNDPKGHIFETKDGGVSFTDVSCSVANCSTPAPTDLPNAPVNDIVIDPDAPGTIYVATDIGVFTTTCTASPCSWTTLGTGLPHVAVLSLRLHEASRTLRAATHGRGAFDVVLNNVTFTGPRISSISPTFVTAGGPAVTLTVNGTGFTSGTVQLNGTPLTTVTNPAPTDTQIQATIPTSMLTTGTSAVTVIVGTNTSNPVKFSILGGPPTITSSAPASAPVNSQSTQTINVVGTGFTAKSFILLNPDNAGTPIPTTFTDSAHLTASVPVSFMANFGSTNSVGVSNPPPGGGTTHTTSTVILPTFVVVAPPPSNDNFAGATLVNLFQISPSNSVFGAAEDTSGATTIATDPILSCVHQQPGGGGQNGSYKTVWFKFTPASNGAITDVDTIGSSYDTTLAVFTGSAGALGQVPGACNDDIDPGIVTQSQLQNMSVSVGTTYYIFVGSFGPPDPNPVALGGKLMFNLTFSPGTPDFTITPQPPISVTVSSGSDATYTVAVDAVNGFSGNVAISCSLPAASTTCAANPPSVSAGSPTTVTVTTTTHQLAPPAQLPQRFGPSGRLVPFVALAMVTLLLLVFARTRRQRLAAALPFTVCLVFLLLQAVGCGGGGGAGSSGTGTPNVHGTQAGTYTVTITGTSGRTTHTTNVTLVVN